MKTFAYLIHPLDTKHFKNFFYLTKFLPSVIVKLFFKKTWPFHVYKIKGMQGYFIALPILFRQSQDQVLEAVEKILAAAEIAKSLGAGILGLGGYTSLLCDKGYTALRLLKMPLTSGSTLSAWSAFEGVFRMSKVKEKELKKSTVAIINANSAIGTLCAKKISEYAAKLIINSHLSTEFKLQHLKETILNLNPLEVIIETDVTCAVKEADIIIFTEDIPAVTFDLASVKPNTIICDVSVNHSLAAKAESRPDITIIEAGLIKLSKPLRSSVNIGLPSCIIPASMAETMLLALEDKLINYSLGENINVDKMEEIADIAAAHGFEVWVPEAPVL